MANDVEVDTQTTVESIASLWLQMGLSSNEMVERIKQIKELHMTVNRNSLKTEQLSLNKLIEYNEKKLQEINVMQSDLTLPPFVTPNDRSLKQIGRILVYKYNELLVLKKERLKQYNELHSKKDKLLKNMNMKSKDMRTATNIPSEEELMHLQSYVSDLSKERQKRFNKYQSFHKILKQLFTDLEREPISEFEKHLLFQTPEEFVLSDDHMKALQTLHSELESCYQQNNDKRKQMEKRLDSLWNKLDVEQSYRDVFYRNKNGCKPSVLSLLEEEIFKYEELKRQNIELFVDKVRQELNEWYDKCYISDEQKDKFRPFMESNEFSEELLDCHETELKRIQEYYEECEEMFAKLEEWHELWERFKELENKANDPNRFNNRGGALLAEEREKNLIKKKLPKVETILKKFSDERQKERQQFFQVFGIPVKQYLENLKMEYQDIKENEKRERQRLKQMELNPQLKGKKVTPICGGVGLRKTPVKRAFTPSSPLPNCGPNTKVRRVGAPLTPSKLNNEINCQSLTKRVNPSRPVPRARARNIQNQFNQMGETHGADDARYASVLSIDEDQFQVFPILYKNLI